MVKTVSIVEVRVRITYCFFFFRGCKVCVQKQWAVESFILFLGCFYIKKEFSTSWKHTVQEGFPGPFKIEVTFSGLLLRNFDLREMRQQQKVGILYEMGKAV